MQGSTVRVSEEPIGAAIVAPAESPISAVSWAAIIAGAFAIAAISLILLALGAGFGFASVSPWSSANPSALTFGIAAAIWLIIVQWLSAAFGGYLTGRLRTKWTAVPNDEVYFRDTAHGFLAWAVATVITVSVLASGAASLIGGAAHIAGQVASGAAQGAGSAAAQSGGSPLSSPLSANGYIVDTLFRTDHPAANANPQAQDAEAARLIAHGLGAGDVPAADKAYLGQLVAARTGLSQPDAEKRVDAAVNQAKAAEVKAKQAADAARKAASYLSFFTAFSMLIGAFIAAVAATVAGHRRDTILALRRRV